MTAGTCVLAVFDEANGAVVVADIAAPALFAGTLLRVLKCTARAATATAAIRPQINTAGLSWNTLAG